LSIFSCAAACCLIPTVADPSYVQQKNSLRARFEQAGPQTPQTQDKEKEREHKVEHAMKKADAAATLYALKKAMDQNEYLDMASGKGTPLKLKSSTKCKEADMTDDLTVVDPEDITDEQGKYVAKIQGGELNLYDPKTDELEEDQFVSIVAMQTPIQTIPNTPCFKFYYVQRKGEAATPKAYCAKDNMSRRKFIKHLTTKAFCYNQKFELPKYEKETAQKATLPKYSTKEYRWYEEQMKAMAAQTQGKVSSILSAEEYAQQRSPAVNVEIADIDTHPVVTINGELLQNLASKSEAAETPNLSRV